MASIAEGTERLASRFRRGPRRGQKRTVLQTIRQFPTYLRLLGGLMVDGRVSALDKALVGAAIAYVLTPFDLIPDFIPFFGEVDDAFFLVLALQRLVDRAGREVLLDHWAGDPDELGDINLRRMMSATAFFLPIGVKRRIREMVAGRVAGKR